MDQGALQGGNLGLDGVERCLLVGHGRLLILQVRDLLLLGRQEGLMSEVVLSPLINPLTE